MISTDISENVLELNKSKLTDQIKDKITVMSLDMSEPFPFQDKEFEIVYAHLAIQFFTHKKTQEIFKEVFRVLKPEGTLAMLNNSINDPQYKTGEKLEDDYYLIEDKKKRFYSIQSTEFFTKNFTQTILDAKGETYKDSEKGVHNLIRFIGKKPIA